MNIDTPLTLYVYLPFYIQRIPHIGREHNILRIAEDLRVHQYFLVRVGLYKNPCACPLSVLSVFRIVNETSTETSLTPGIDQIYSTNSWPGVHRVYNVDQLTTATTMYCGGLRYPEFALGYQTPFRIVVLDD